MRKVVALEFRTIDDARKRQCLDQTFCGGSRNATRVVLELLREDRSLVDFHDLALSIDKKCSGQAEIAVAVEQISIKDVVDSQNILSRTQDGK